MVSRILAHPSLHASAAAAPSTRGFPCPPLYRSEFSLRSAWFSGFPYHLPASPQSSCVDDYDKGTGRLHQFFSQLSPQLAALLYLLLTQLNLLLGQHRQSLLLSSSALQAPAVAAAGFTPSSQVSAPAAPTTRGLALPLLCRPDCATSSSRPDQPRRRDASLISFGREALPLSARSSAHAGLSRTHVATPQLGDYGQPIAPLKGHDRFLHLMAEALFTPMVISPPSIGGSGDPATPLRSRAIFPVLACSGTSTATTCPHMSTRHLFEQGAPIVPVALLASALIPPSTQCLVARRPPASPSWHTHYSVSSATIQQLSASVFAGPTQAPAHFNTTFDGPGNSIAHPHYSLAAGLAAQVCAPPQHMHAVSTWLCTPSRGHASPMCAYFDSKVTIAPGHSTTPWLSLPFARPLTPTVPEQHLPPPTAPPLTEGLSHLSAGLTDHSGPSPSNRCVHISLMQPPLQRAALLPCLMAPLFAQIVLDILVSSATPSVDSFTASLGGLHMATLLLSLNLSESTGILFVAVGSTHAHAPPVHTTLLIENSHRLPPASVPGTCFNKPTELLPRHSMEALRYFPNSGPTAIPLYLRNSAIGRGTPRASLSTDISFCRPATSLPGEPLPTLAPIPVSTDSSTLEFLSNYEQAA